MQILIVLEFYSIDCYNIDIKINVLFLFSLIKSETSRYYRGYFIEYYYYLLNLVFEKKKKEKKNYQATENYSLFDTIKINFCNVNIAELNLLSLHFNFNSVSNRSVMPIYITY